MKMISRSGGLTRRQLVALAALEVAALAAGDAAGAQPLPAPLFRRSRFGAYASTGLPLVDDHRALEKLVGRQLPVFSWFKDWGGGWDPGLAQQISGLSPTVQYDCMIAWEAWKVPFADINNGGRDQFLSDFFDGARTYSGQVLLRLFHEMNGNWYPWSAAANGNATGGVDQWKAAWRRIVAIARDRNASNVSFVFCVNANDVGGIRAEEYWPGSSWVDVLGIDGYNWGWRGQNPTKTAQQLLSPMYSRLTALHRSAPLIVGELGCAPHPRKGEWFRDLYLSTRFPRLASVSFFHTNKERDWRLNSDATSLAVNRTYLAQAPLNPTTR